MARLDKKISQQLRGLVEQIRPFVDGPPAHREELLVLLSDLYKEIQSLVDDKQETSPLSKRESEILGHVSRGFSSREVASALGVSIKTIEFHLGRVYEKLEVSSRTEAVALVVKKGWV